MLPLGRSSLPTTMTYPRSLLMNVPEGEGHEA
jgi:hypothetical protein